MSCISLPIAVSLAPDITQSRLHPAVRLLAWSAGVLLGQYLVGQGLLWGLLVVVLSAGGCARKRFVALLRRTRIVLLSIVLLFVCGTPGTAWWPELGAVAPTREGVALALEHAARLVWVLAWLALLLEFTRPSDLVAGLYSVLRPFAAEDLRRKAAVRLLLVLQYVEAERKEGPRRPWLGGLDWLEREDVPAGPLLMTVRPFSLLDRLLMAALLLLALAALGKVVL